MFALLLSLLNYDLYIFLYPQKVCLTRRVILECHVHVLMYGSGHVELNTKLPKYKPQQNSKQRNLVLNKKIKKLLSKDK